MVESCTQTVDVGPFIGAMSLNLFRGAILGSTNDLISLGCILFDGAGKSEVDQLDVAECIDDQVGRFDIAVNDSLISCFFQSTRR